MAHLTWPRNGGQDPADSSPLTGDRADRYTVAMKEFRGVPASPGIAIGRAFLYSDDDLTIPEYPIHVHQVSVEMARYRTAVGRAVIELEQIKVRTGPSGDPDGFLDTHLMMLQDPEIEAKIDLKIGKVLKNVEWVLQDVVDELVSKLSTVQDAYLKERTLDIRDVSRRVLNHLLQGGGRGTLADLKEEVIVVTPSLMPSDAVSMNKKLVLGLAMDQGGKTTHTAILARSFEIPAVLGLVRLTREVRLGGLARCRRQRRCGPSEPRAGHPRGLSGQAVPLSRSGGQA